MFLTVFLALFVTSPLMLLVGSVGRTAVRLSRGGYQRPLAIDVETRTRSTPAMLQAEVAPAAAATAPATAVPDAAVPRPAAPGRGVSRPIGAGADPDAATVLAFRPRMQQAPVDERAQISG
jgi:hypothetical protein